MKVTLALVLGALVLGLSAVTASAAPSTGGVNPHYVFTFQKGLNKVKLGGTTNGYKAVFGKAVSLPNIGSGICYGLAYAVSPTAQKSRTADLQLYCGDKPQITETHFASSAFCSAGGTCVGTPGSLRKFAAELKAAAKVVPDMECVSGGGSCTSVYAAYGPIQVEIRSANCRNFASVAAIGPQCVAADVLIYLEAR